MTATVWYTQSEGNGQTKRKRGRPRKVTTMTPTQATETKPVAPAPAASPVTRTVFDLTLFDDVKLSKPFVAPTKPTSIEEALAAVGNDAEKLLNVIFEGLSAEARNTQYDNLEGFKVVEDEGETDYQYMVGKPALDESGNPILDESGNPTFLVKPGQPADEKKGKLINGAILNMAKMFAGGSWDSLKGKEGKAKKDEYRKQAEDMLRANPAALASLAG